MVGQKAKSISFRLVQIEIPCDLRNHGITVKFRVDAWTRLELPHAIVKMSDTLVGYVCWGRPPQVYRWSRETLRAERPKIAGGGPPNLLPMSTRDPQFCHPNALAL